MLLKSAGYSILSFTIFVIILGVINLVTFKRYSISKKGEVVILDCNVKMEMELNWTPKSKKWEKIGDSRRFKKNIKVDKDGMIDRKYEINKVRAEKRLQKGEKNEIILFTLSKRKPVFYTQCDKHVKYNFDGKKYYSKVKKKYKSVGRVPVVYAKVKDTPINILVNKKNPKDIIKSEFHHNFNPYLLFILSIILILLAVFLIYVDGKVEEIGGYN